MAALRSPDATMPLKKIQGKSVTKAAQVANLNETDQTVMNRYQSISTTLFIGIFILMCSRAANACGSCVMALFDSFLPPVMGWVKFTIFWFLALSSVSLNPA